MIKLDRILFLYIIIFLEGYVVLAAELLAIRQTIPYIGSGTDTVSIIIAAVLMPLAFGYHAGGRFRPGKNANGRYIGIRDKLISNIMRAMLILLIGLSYALISAFFITLMNMGVQHRLVLTAIYSGVFLVTPVYLLGQTIPLVSHYFSHAKLSEITGRMLFFSTVGSFMGAVFSTLVLMSTIGVHHTASLVLVVLAFLVFLLSRRKTSETVLYAGALAIVALVMNSDSTMKVFSVVDNNLYNTIAVIEEDGERHLFMNNTDSSMYTEDGRKHPYAEFAEKIAIDPIMAQGDPKDILVIGAGAFTFGIKDKKNRYDFVDMDKALKWVAEDYILKQKLNDNVTFHPLEIRAYFMSTKKKYDMIFLDAYLGDLTLPEHLVTQDFFKQVKAHLKDNGVVLANFIISPNFSSAFSRHIDNTFRSVFPHISRHVMEDRYILWGDNPNDLANVIYIYRDHPGANPEAIYTDNKNRVFYDKPKSRSNSKDESKGEAPKDPAPASE